MATYPDGAVQVFAEVIRLSTLDQNGFIAAGAAVYSTNLFIKATATPNLETGVDLAQVNANGDLIAHYKHGDMPKYYEMQLQIATADPIVHAIITGGTVLGSSTAALGAPTTPTAQAYTTLGTLATATYGYKTSNYNQYGDTVASAEVTASVTGPTGAVVVVPTIAATAVGCNIYGRTPGGEQLMFNMLGIGSQATSAASGTGTPTSLTTTALTKPIPQGYTFQIAGDTNTPKIIFTTTAAAGVGALAVAVSVSQSITTTIAAGAINPVFLDTGSISPLGTPPSVDNSAGVQDVGYQAPALGIVGAPYGFGMELFTRETLNGTGASYLPYNRWVFPKVVFGREDASTFDASLYLPTYNAIAVENPNWGTGPFGDWQFDSSKVFQYARCSHDIVPTSSLTTVGATY